MNDFDLLTKPEISYILNNEKLFGSNFQNQVISYCSQKREGYQNVEVLIPEWKENEQELLIERTQTEINISRPQENGKSEFFEKFILLLIMMFYIILVGGATWYLLSWGAIPVFAFLIYLFAPRIKDLFREESIYKKSIEISELNTIRAYLDEELRKEKEIEEINFFWNHDPEYDTTTIHLELRVSEKWAIVIDNGVNYLELLRVGAEISVFTKKRLNVIRGKTELWPIFEL